MTEPVLLDSEAALAEYLSEPARARAARCWAYVRVSSRKQEKEGLGLEGQVAEICAYCRERQMPEPVFVVEVAGAGKPLLQLKLPGQESSNAGDVAPRPLFSLLLGFLSDTGKGTHDLVVWKLDRFSRGGSEQELLLRMLWRAETTVHSTGPGEDELLHSDGGDPSRALMRQILAAFSQYERALIQARMELGMRAKAARGGWVCGSSPYGYEPHERDLRVVAEEARLVAAVFYLRRLDYTYRGIANEMPRRFGARDPWNVMKVSRVIHNHPIYSGTYIDPYGAKHTRPDLKVLPDDWETWGAEHDPQYAKALA